jgi:hypothetical protein
VFPITPTRAVGDGFADEPPLAVVVAASDPVATVLAAVEFAEFPGAAVLDAAGAGVFVAAMPAAGTVPAVEVVVFAASPATAGALAWPVCAMPLPPEALSTPTEFAALAASVVADPEAPALAGGTPALAGESAWVFAAAEVTGGPAGLAVVLACVPPADPGTAPVAPAAAAVREESAARAAVGVRAPPLAAVTATGPPCGLEDVLAGAAEATVCPPLDGGVTGGEWLPADGKFPPLGAVSLVLAAAGLRTGLALTPLRVLAKSWPCLPGCSASAVFAALFCATVFMTID